MQRTTGGSWPSVYAQHYSYDRWGNRWINSATTWGTNIFNTVITPDSANNRLTGMTYDSAGNTTNDPITGVGARTYDADNRMISAQSGATWNYYVYDADGKRVRRIVTGTETWHVYGFSGELLAEYPVNGAANAPSKEYANGGQTMIVGDATNVRWTVADSLGTPRIVVGKTGALADVTRHDYLPFGEELFVGMGTGSIRTTGMGYANSGTNDGVRKKFTGYERDDETGLDYAQARYYSSKQGRFTSPDEFTGGPDELYDFADVASENPMIYAELDEPQSLNKYQYCFNNPLSLVDPDGHKSWKDWARTVVEVATYVPGPIGTVASVVQAVDKLAQGDYAGAASSALGAVPGAKLVRAGAKALDKVADVSRAVDKANDLRKEAKAFRVDSHGKQPSPRGDLQSHHIIQDKWAKNNVDGYNTKQAPSILLPRKNHSSVTTAQNARRDARVEAGKGKWSSSIRQEFDSASKDLREAGVPDAARKKALKRAYKYFDEAGAFKENN